LETEDPPTEERWRDVRRVRLLDAAGRVFARLGYETASVEDIAYELEGRLDCVLDRHGAFPEVLPALIAEIVPTFRTHLASLRGLNEGGEMSKRRLFRQRRARIEARLVTAIERAQAMGEIRAIEPGVAARFLIGLVWSGTNSSLPDDPSVVAAVVDFALSGFKGGAA
jgi:AcrR family transcriptional regulator